MKVRAQVTGVVTEIRTISGVTDLWRTLRIGSFEPYQEVGISISVRDGRRYASEAPFSNVGDYVTITIGPDEHL